MTEFNAVAYFRQTGGMAEQPRYFHGTRYPFKPGDLIEPGRKSNQGYGQANDRVFFTHRPEIAKHFADSADDPEGHEGARPRVYEVEPTGPHELDTDELPEDAERAGSRQSRHPLRVVQEHHSTWEPDEDDHFDASEFEDEGCGECGKAMTKEPWCKNCGDQHHTVCCEEGDEQHHTASVSITATAFFKKTHDALEGGSNGRADQESARTAGQGRPRRQPGAGGEAAGAGQDAAGGAPAVGADQGGAGPVGPRQVSFHPAAKKELLKLDGASRKRVAATINALQRGDEGLQTHALTQPLKGWSSTKASRGHRVIHRDLDDGTLHIGYIGLHEYDKAINRLSSLTDFFRTADLRETASVDDDYRMQHRAPGPQHAPLHDPMTHDEFGPSETVDLTHLTPRTSALQLTEPEERLLQREAAAVAHDHGVMVALVPPREIAEQLAMADGQPVDDLHITLAYLGNVADYRPDQLARLPRVVAAWASGQRPVTVRVGGVGTFNNAYKDQHVLYAAMDIPGGAQVHTSLAQHLERHGYRLPSEHGWTPHMTLRYVDRHHRFMPQLDGHNWEATEVVTYLCGERHPACLGIRPTTTL